MRPSASDVPRNRKKATGLEARQPPRQHSLSRNGRAAHPPECGYLAIFYRIVASRPLRPDTIFAGAVCVSSVCVSSVCVSAVCVSALLREGCVLSPAPATGDCRGNQHFFGTGTENAHNTHHPSRLPSRPPGPDVRRRAERFRATVRRRAGLLQRRGPAAAHGGIGASPRQGRLCQGLCASSNLNGPSTPFSPRNIPSARSVCARPWAWWFA